MNNQFRVSTQDITGKPCHISFFNNGNEAAKKAKELANVENRTYYVHKNINGCWWSTFAVDSKGNCF